MLAVSDLALQAIRKVIADQTEANGLRISVATGGCQGYRYQIGLEESGQTGDSVFDFEGVKVYVDPTSLALLDGARIDFVDALEGSGFVFENPNAQGKCGCGKSFSC